MIYGSASVSTDGKTVDAQVKRRRAAGIKKSLASGANTARAQSPRAIAALGKGDVSLVKRLDRLARSTRDLSQ
jgi:DNA invertase Pin-like site-specific DNA recombinase